MERQKKRSKGQVIILVVVLVAVAVIVGLWATGMMGGSYPLEYMEEIAKYATENGLDPYFVAAVIYTESGFDPEAVSRVGAMGLMQVMPETGEWIAPKLGVDNFTADDLFDPETNIQFGCWYLGFLNERFDGKEQLILAGYNAGQGRVDEWLADSSVSDGEVLTDIPFKETDDYVKKVDKAAEKYREEYPGAF